MRSPFQIHVALSFATSKVKHKLVRVIVPKIVNLHFQITFHDDVENLHNLEYSYFCLVNIIFVHITKINVLSNDELSEAQTRSSPRYPKQLPEQREDNRDSAQKWRQSRWPWRAPLLSAAASMLLRGGRRFYLLTLQASSVIALWLPHLQFHLRCLRSSAVPGSAQRRPSYREKDGGIFPYSPWLPKVCFYLLRFVVHLWPGYWILICRDLIS